MTRFDGDLILFDLFWSSKKGQIKELWDFSQIKVLNEFKKIYKSVLIFILISDVINTVATPWIKIHKGVSVINWYK